MDRASLAAWLEGAELALDDDDDGLAAPPWRGSAPVVAAFLVVCEAHRSLAVRMLLTAPGPLDGTVTTGLAESTTGVLLTVHAALAEFVAGGVGEAATVGVLVTAASSLREFAADPNAVQARVMNGAGPGGRRERW